MNIELMQILKLLLYFIIYSFFGWVIESVFKTILEKKWVNSGFLYGPFCPIYGFGAAIMMLILSPFKNNIILLFITAFFVLSIWEYIAGWLLEKKFNTKYWDYTDNFMNINGRVCLLNSIFWGVLGVVFTTIIHPFTAGFVEGLSSNTIIIADIILCIVMGIDAIITTIHIKSFDSSIQKIKEIGETIKQKVSELKEINKSSPENSSENSSEKIKSYEKLIDDLKEKQEILKIKLYKQMTRLKLAFPKIKSESISKFLNQKNEFKELKEKIKSKISNNKE